MNCSSISKDTGSAPDGSALALLRIPFIFTQDQLLRTEDFIKEAKERGYELSLTDLQELHRHRLLLPLFRVSDHPVAGRIIPVHGDGDPSPRGWALEAARKGRLRDCLDEGYSTAWPYARPEGEEDGHWWNGFLFSVWQVADLDHALKGYGYVQRGWNWPIDQRWMDEARRRTIVLAALATRHLPDILGKLSWPMGVDHDELWEFRHACDVADLLQLAGFKPEHLRPVAEDLLHSASSRDPMDAWWPLIRRSGDSGWSKLKEVARDCLWQRVAAEVLLRTHEELAERGILERLPDLTGSTWHDALHDRITPRERDAETLNRTLAKFGLSPHPRVLLLLEGQTEMIQVGELLKELRLNRPDRVHLQNCRSSSVNPQLISRYAIAPRLGLRRGGAQLLDRPPTALVIAMDPENRWCDEAAREKARCQLQQAIREEVECQNGTIAQQDLDFLVNIYVWGEDTYELANFTDDELVPAITQLATEQSLPAVELSSWETDLRDALQAARAAHCDFQHEVGPRLRVREDKPRLARILMPTLLAKYQAELAAGEVTTPVLRVIQEVRRLVVRLSGENYMLSQADDHA